MPVHTIEQQKWSAPSATDTITVRRAMNGFTIESGERLTATTAPLPYVFESSESLFQWISDKFICEDTVSEGREDE